MAFQKALAITMRISMKAHIKEKYENFQLQNTAKKPHSEKLWPGGKEWS